MALHDELIQRMKTVADADSQAVDDDDDDEVLPIVVFEPSNSDPDLGRVDVQRVDPDRLPPAPRQPAEKKPAVVTPPSADSRPARAVERGGGSRSAPAQGGGVAARRSTRLVVCVNKYGDKQGELKDPLGVACLPAGEIVVSEWGNRRLQVFDASGRSLRLIAPGQVERAFLIEGTSTD